MMLIVSTDLLAALVRCQPTVAARRIVEILFALENILDKSAKADVRFALVFVGAYTVLYMKVGEWQTMESGHVLDRALRYRRAASRRLRPRVIPASLVLMVRTVLLGCLGLGTLHAQTIRPDDRTVLMAMPFTKVLSKPWIWGQERSAGSNRGSPRVHCHGRARLPYPEATPYLRFFKAVVVGVWWKSPSAPSP
jgi:hypothetical protein